jgi:hypothetical protein
MATSACPFCFALVDTTGLAYQCSGRGAGGERCEPAEDELRVKRTGSHALSYPTFSASPQKNGRVNCPTCDGPARRRACPECHTAVPESFVDTDSPLLGIVGSKGSGKTVLMTVLTKQLRDNIGKRFGAAVRFATDNPDGFEGVGQYTKDREESMFLDGKLPIGTVQNAQERRRPVVMMWQSEVSGRFGSSQLRSTTLSFIDSAGEDFNKLEDAYSLDYLTVCDGLMVTLDPFALPGARSVVTLPQGATDKSSESDPLQVIERITEILRIEHEVKKNKKIKVPLAVVFTKIDAFFPLLQQDNPIMAPSGSTIAYSEMDGQNVHEHMRALLHQWGADQIDLHLRYNYDAFRFFGVSALGAQPIYTEDRVAPGGVRPHRIEDPILWLLAKERAVKST